MRDLPQENELIAYTTGFPPGRRWLVLAPHPDDEVFGLGATLVLAQQQGVDIKVVIATDGGAQGEVSVRKREAVDAAAVLGLPAPHFLGLPDRALWRRRKELRQALNGLIDDFQPDSVFVTSPVEVHPDHRALAMALQRVLRRRLIFGLRSSPLSWVVAYEVSSPLLANLLVLSPLGWETKMRAVNGYASQLAFRPYHQMVEALGTIRTLPLSVGEGERAEGFHVQPAPRVARWSHRRWASEMGSPRGVAPRFTPS